MDKVTFDALNLLTNVMEKNFTQAAYKASPKDFYLGSILLAAVACHLYEDMNCCEVHALHASIMQHKSLDLIKLGLALLQQDCGLQIETTKSIAELIIGVPKES